MILQQRTPDFSNLAAVLERKVPARPTLFTFFMYGRLYDKLLSDYPSAKEKNNCWRLAHALARAGYDYVTVRAGFALGSGNSILSYIPDENYFAMTRAALKIN